MNEKRALLLANVGGLTLYLVGLFLNERLAFPYLVNVVGVLYLLVLTPYTFSYLLGLRFSNRLDALLASLVFYFFLYSPLFYLLNRLLGLAVTDVSVLTANVLIALLAFLRSSLAPGPSPVVTLNLSKQKLHARWPLWGTLLLYGLLHYINFRFYLFIPEWDSYNKLVEIDKAIETGRIETNYRGFFTSSQVLLGAFSHLSAYQLFTSVMIAVQAAPLIALYRLLQRFSVKKGIFQFGALLAALSVPVLNLEIDNVRPQNVALFALPLYLYFLYLANKENKPQYWFTVLAIAIFGLNYHEFFVLISGTFFLGFIFQYSHRVSRRVAHANYVPWIFLTGVLFASLIEFMANKLVIFEVVGNILKYAVRQIANTESWRLWFIDSYNTDGSALSVGWPGIGGALKYYGYYMSPIIALLLGLMLLYLFKRRELQKNLLWQTAWPPLLAFLAIAEILPRLNFVYLPERYWVLIITVVLTAGLPLLMPTLQKNVGRTSQALAAVWLVAVLTGLGGSLYLANSKGALTSKNEYAAAVWIENNTPVDSIFISQAANSPMVRYFGKRELVVPADPAFFLSPMLQPLPLGQESALPSTLAEEERGIERQFEQLKEHEYRSLKEFTSYVERARERIAEIKKSEAASVNSKPLYVLYSHDKLSGIYAEREWWQQSNFFNASLGKFNEAYPLVYSQDGILIWQIPLNQ